MYYIVYISQVTLCSHAIQFILIEFDISILLSQQLYSNKHKNTHWVK